MRKYPNAGREWGWQWVFPATRVYADRMTGQRRRHHLHETVLQRAVSVEEVARPQWVTDRQRSFQDCRGNPGAR
jgi:hypothetical protein